MWSLKQDLIAGVILRLLSFVLVLAGYDRSISEVSKTEVVSVTGASQVIVDKSTNGYDPSVMRLGLFPILSRTFRIRK
jgi:hypothetical protein